MNYLLHRHRCPGHIVPIPEDLNELMADISKEVIRSQPKNIPCFIADFLESMLLTRECTRIAMATVNDVMDYAMDVVTFYVTTTIPESKAKHAVKVFQRLFKEKTLHEQRTDITQDMARFDEEQLCCRLMEECGLNQNDAMKAIEIFNNAYKMFYYRQQEFIPQLGPDAGWDDKVKNILHTYARSKPTQEEMNCAARCLQSAYRGFRVRRRQQKQTEEENAIVTIQSIVRGYLTRKHMAKEGQSNEKIEYLTTTDTDNAAKMIQNIYRGHKTRLQDALNLRNDFKTVSAMKSVRNDQEEQPMTRKKAKRAIVLPETNTSKQSVTKKSNVRSGKLSPKDESSLEDILVVKSVKLSPRISKESMKRI